MTRRELWDKVYDAARSVYEEREARSYTAVVCEGRLGMRFTDVIVEPAAPCPDHEELPQILAAIRDHCPAQYITGFAWFLDRKFAVREGVLIPRPETEELVRMITDRYRGRSGLRVLDVGTGSGCIAVTLAAEMKQAKVVAVDVSESALEVARENARRHRVSVDFVRCDMLQEGPSGHFDLIVSNPPYVTLQEKDEMRPNVLRYEPHRALFVPDDDPLVFYRAIAEYGCRSLNPGGMLWFELNERYGSEVASLLEQSGYSEVTVHEDMFGKQRMAEAVWR